MSSRKVGEYVIVEAWDPQFVVAQSRLYLKVNTRLEDGWEPLGGVTIVWRPLDLTRGSEGYFQLAQALVKRR